MVSFLLLLLYIFCEYFRLADIIPLLKAFPYMKVLAGMLFLTVFLERGKINFFADLRQNRLLAVIIVCMVFSVPFSFNRGLSFYGTIDFCKVILIFIVFLNLVDNLPNIKIVMWIILFSAFYMVYQAVKFFMLGGVERFSSYSTLAGGDTMAAFFVVVIPLAIGLLRLSKSLIIKILLMGSLVSYFIGIFTTQSRGGFLGIIAITACYIFKAKKRGLTLFFVVVVALGAFAILPKGPLERFTTVNISERKTGDSTDERIELWKSGLRMAKDHPLFGVGMNCFPTAVGTVYRIKSWRPGWLTAHNSFVLILGEVGVIAFLCYLGIYYLNFKDIKIIRRRLAKGYIKPEVKREISILSNAFEISLIGFTVPAFFLSLTYNLDMFLITAFIVVLRRITERLTYNNQPQTLEAVQSSLLMHS